MPPGYRSLVPPVRVLDPGDVPSSLSFEVGEVRDRLPPGWRVVVLEVDGDLVVTGEPPSLSNWVRGPTPRASGGTGRRD